MNLFLNFYRRVKIDKKGNSSIHQRCDACTKFLQDNPNLKRNQLQKCRDKIKKIQSAENFISTCDASLEECAERLQEWKSLIKTQNVHLSSEGLALKRALKDVQKYIECRTTSQKTGKSSSFLTNFLEFYQKYPQFEETAICDLLKNAINRLQGNTSSKLPDRIRNLFMVAYSISPKAARFFSGNMFGPTDTNMRKAGRKVDKSRPCLSNFLTRTVQDVADDIVTYVISNYEKDRDIVTMSLSIDGTKVSPLLQEDEGVKDGVNVRDIYRRVDLSQITEVYGSIK